MYSVVLLAAVTMGGESADCGRRCGCHGYGGGYSMSYGGCYGGGYGGCYGGYGGCYGGGGYGGCYGGYGGCYGGGGYGGCYGGYGYGGGGIVYGSCAGGIVTAPPTGDGTGTGTGNGKTAPNPAIQEVIDFLKAQKVGEGEDTTGKELLAELEKAQETAESQKEWVDTYTPALTPEEEKAVEAFRKGLKTEDEKKDFDAFWKAAKTPASKRYAMSYYGIEVPTAAPANLVVTLPASASLSVDGQPTVSTSSRRVFVSPKLEPGKTYHYTLRATYTENGAPVVVTRKVSVRAGKTSEVSLEAAPAVAAR